MKRVTKEFINSNPKGLWLTSDNYSSLIFLPKEVSDPIIKSAKEAFNAFKNPTNPRQVEQGYATYSYLIAACDEIRTLTFLDSLPNEAPINRIEVWLYFKAGSLAYDIEVTLGVGDTQNYFELSRKFSIKRDLKKLEKGLATDNQHPLEELELKEI